MSPTAAQFIEAARAELGTTESPAGSNRTTFAAEAGHANGAPWCMTFIVAIARRVGVRLESESAYTPTVKNAYAAAGCFHTSPQPGDIAFFDFPDAKRRVQHVGIVVSSTATSVTCIEGNTSAGASGSQDNGGGVYRRTRPRSHVVGFGRPTFVTAASSPSGPQRPAPSRLEEALVLKIWFVPGQTARWAVLFIGDFPVLKWRIDHLDDAQYLRAGKFSEEQQPPTVLEAVPVAGAVT